MLADSHNTADRTLDLKTKNAINEKPKNFKTHISKYQCIACQINKVSLSELHWHQTYRHSTEELSLSVIGWKGLVKIVGPPSEQEKENVPGERSIWSSFSKNPSQFYYLSSSILCVKENQKEYLEAPIDCSLTLAKVEKDIETPEQINKNVLLDSTLKEDLSTYEKWEKELNWIQEISMEDFIKGANELCSELEIYKRLTALKKASKRKHVL